MNKEPSLHPAHERTLWPAIGRIAKFAAIAGPLVALAVWLVPPPFGARTVSVQVLDATKQYSPGDLELRGPHDETRYLDAAWTCTVPVSWVGILVRVLDGRTGIEVTSAYLRPDSGHTAKLWIR